MNKILLAYTLEKYFKGHPNLEIAELAILQLVEPHFLDKIVANEEPIEFYKPAYQDSSPNNLTADSKCRICNMIWYNCLCSHEG